MIQARAPVTGWHEVDRDTALRVARFYHRKITCIKDKIRYINTHKLKGISFTEDVLDEHKAGT